MACSKPGYKFYYRGLCSFASRWVPVSTAEDIVQDAMLYIWENRDKLLEELSLKGLLFMIVRNKAFDRIAHRQVRQRVHQQLSERFAERFESPTSISVPSCRVCTTKRSPSARTDAPHLRDEPPDGDDAPADRRRTRRLPCKRSTTISRRRCAHSA